MIQEDLDRIAGKLRIIDLLIWEVERVLEKYGPDADIIIDDVSISAEVEALITKFDARFVFLTRPGFCETREIKCRDVDLRIENCGKKFDLYRNARIALM